MNTNQSTEKKLVWLSFDLAVDSDYEGMYSFLNKMGAKECCGNTAVFEHIDFPKLDESIKLKIIDCMKINEKKDRLYIMFFDVDRQKYIGKWISGRRKTPVWFNYHYDPEDSLNTVDELPE